MSERESIRQLLNDARRLADDGYISIRKHPVDDLYVYNYTAKAQYQNNWTPATMQCRGLIATGDGEIVARPFPKFFNLEQLSRSEIALSKPFKVTHKMDGSLGVLYRSTAGWAIATRGAFESPQAQRATEMLHGKYADFEPTDGLTYLFEIIYPENRIVVDYGNREELTLLAVLDTATGRDMDGTYGWPGPCAGEIAIDSCRPFDIVDTLSVRDDRNVEGFVLRFDWPKHGPQFRCKIKLDDYKRLHRLLTGISERSIWESLSQGVPIDEIVRDVPDEFFDWVTQIHGNLTDDFAAIEDTARQQMRSFDSRKDAAIYFKTCMYPHLMFAMMDGKDYAPIIWSMIKPSGGSAFRCASEATA